MIVMISLQYPTDEGPVTLDHWNLEAPSVAAVHHMIAEDLGPVLRRRGRTLATENWFDEVEYCPQALMIKVEAAPAYTVEELCQKIADGRSSPGCGAACAGSLRRPERQQSEVPASVVAVLTKHGIRGVRGKRLAYKPPKVPEQKATQQWDGDDDDCPF